MRKTWWQVYGLGHRNAVCNNIDHDWFSFEQLFIVGLIHDKKNMQNVMKRSWHDTIRSKRYLHVLQVYYDD